MGEGWLETMMSGVPSLHREPRGSWVHNPCCLSNAREEPEATIEDMPLSSQNLLKELKQRRGDFNWALELKNGKESYAFLMHVIGTSELNVIQTRNGLHALFKIRGHGSTSEVLRKFVDLSTNPNQWIRSEAVELAIGLAKISAKCEKVPALLSPDQERTLRNAMGLGLSKKVTRLALGYFSTKDSAGAKSVS
jgi:hypothetical protein